MKALIENLVVWSTGYWSFTFNDDSYSGWGQVELEDRLNELLNYILMNAEMFEPPKETGVKYVSDIANK